MPWFVAVLTRLLRDTAHGRNASARFDAHGYRIAWCRAGVIHRC
jgi:hypothetical protein